jgi:hypothetical protein
MTIPTSPRWLLNMQHEPRPEAPAAVPPLSFTPQRTTGTLTFPHGATAVTLDDKGRIKLPTRLNLESWREGALGVVIVAGWAVITQPNGYHTKQITRNSHIARFDERFSRLLLRLGHRTSLGVTFGDTVLLAPSFHRDALIVVSPDAALWSEHPPHIVQRQLHAAQRALTLIEGEAV